MSTITIQIDNDQPIKSVSVEFYDNGSVSSINKTPSNNNDFIPASTAPVALYDDKVLTDIPNKVDTFKNVNEDDYLNNDNITKSEEVLVPNVVPDTTNRESKVVNTMNQEV